MPLQRRLPKRGFTNIFKEQFEAVNIKDLSGFEKDSEIDVTVLKRAGLIRKMRSRVKLLGDGEIAHPLFIKVDKVSMSARKKIEDAGGRVELV